MEILSRVLQLPTAGVDGVVAWLLKLRSDLGVPHTLADLGVGDDRLKELAAAAERDPSTGSNPVAMTAADFELLITDALHGAVG